MEKDVTAELVALRTLQDVRDSLAELIRDLDVLVAQRESADEADEEDEEENKPL